MKDAPGTVSTPAANPRVPRPWYQLSVRQAAALICGIGCMLAVVVIFARAVQSAREAARRSQCVCNFCQITLALRNYETAYGTLPPAHVDDAQGKPMHSWRVLILPFMEQSALYNAYNFSEPWDGPSNRRLIPQRPAVYACPSRDPGRTTNLTSYVVVNGPHTAFPDGKPIAFADISDETAKTLLAVEVDNVDIVWTEPRDLDVRTMSFRINDPRRPGISSPHPDGANVSFADGGYRFLLERVTPGQLRALVTVDGGETIDLETALSRK